MTLVPLAVPSKRYFASPFRVDNECPRDTGEVFPRRRAHFDAACPPHDVRYRRFLTLTQFENGNPARREMRGEPVNDGTIGIQSIRSAIEREPGIMIAHFRRQ